MFAKLLMRIYEVLKPAVTILDGITAMEGQGPGKGGTPRQLDVLMASDDAIAMDITVCKMFGIEPDSLLTVKSGRQIGLIPEKIMVEGELPIIRDLKLPEITPLVFGPDLTHGFLRKHMVQRPVSSKDLCRLCGDCLKYCPAAAIERSGNEIRFDYDKCIRCYCCIEVCPHGALRTEEPLLGRIVSRIMSRDRK
jgi:ferredoxin